MFIGSVQIDACKHILRKKYDLQEHPAAHVWKTKNKSLIELDITSRTDCEKLPFFINTLLLRILPKDER